MSEFLLAAAAYNNHSSVSSQIAMSVANAIPINTEVEDFASKEEKEQRAGKKLSKQSQKKSI